MDKQVLITGGNSGIGLETAKQLVARGAAVTLACRDQTKGQAALAHIKNQHPDASVSVVALDLASLDSVRECAETVLARFPKIDVLINNAGVVPTRQQHTADGYEMQFGVNYLGPVLLTHLLLPALEKAAPARIVHLSSVAHWLGRINPNTWQGRFPYLVMDAYGQSKLGNLMFSNELARRLDPRRITSNALHPGGVDTGIFRHVPKPVYNLLIKPTLITAEKAATLPVSLALDDKWAHTTGEYIANHKVSRCRPVANNSEALEALYEQSCAELGLEPLPPFKG
jgi:NAD(P)-dependent dehydrogenase (short-subunit alcohol dehydrogenase family)